MYVFFVVFGFLFISVAATFLTYIYEVFPISKVTDFLSPITNRSIWGRINVTVFPNIIWALIELPILGSKGNFILATIVNIFISCAVLYEIRYGALVFFNKENNTINLISIYIATLLGQAISFMIFKMKSLFMGNFFISIIGMMIILGIYVVITINPPKNRFFRGKEKKD